MSSSQVRIAAASHAIILAGQAVGQFSDESLRFLYDDTIQMINQVAPISKSESPLLIDDQINKMREGEALEASWMYKGYNKKGEEDILSASPLSFILNLQFFTTSEMLV
jgi:hypothetical protein